MGASTALKNAKYNDRVFQKIVDKRRAARMDAIDNLDPGLRELVHEYGWTVVKAFYDIGIRSPKHIRHLVETVLNEFSPTRGSFASQGSRNAVKSMMKPDHQS